MAPRRWLSVVVAVGAGGMCLPACHHATAPSSDGSPVTRSAATAEVASSEAGDASVDNGRLDATSTFCGCEASKLVLTVGRPIAADERPVEGYAIHLFSGEWTPVCSEMLGCTSGHRPLQQDQLESFWKRYQVLRSTPALPKCPHDAQAVVVLSSNTGSEHWVAVGRGFAYEAGSPAKAPGKAYMETEDHVCHALNVPLFRELVDLLDIRKDAMTDREYRKYL